MRIAIDTGSLAIPHKTGVAKYVLRLVEHLEELDDGNEYLTCYRLSRWKKRKYFYRPKKASTKLKLFQEPLFTGRGIDGKSKAVEPVETGHHYFPGEARLQPGSPRR